jgi:methylthioribose-1-phosphate isomerase
MSTEPTPTDYPDRIRPVRFVEDRLILIDQRRLPLEQIDYPCTNADEVATAIRDMVVRGAPAIGITAAYGVVLACRQATRDSGPDWQHNLEQAIQRLAQARPTAVNLAWALARMQDALRPCASAEEALKMATAEADAILAEDIAANRRMGMLGAELIDSGSGVLTHCNTGSLATGGFGTALGVIRTAWAEGRLARIFADETRPWLQGSRLTAWELLQDGIDVTLLCEGAAASLLRSGAIRWVIVGADRIAANGDTANKIGTYGLACLARMHGVQFMVVAPFSTIDLAMPTGDGIPIEERAVEEITQVAGRIIAPSGAGAWNPAFDVTPGSLIDAIVTERGVLRPPYDEAAFRALLPRR